MTLVVFESGEDGGSSALARFPHEKVSVFCVMKFVLSSSLVRCDLCGFSDCISCAIFSSFKVETTFLYVHLYAFFSRFETKDRIRTVMKYFSHFYCYSFMIYQTRVGFEYI